MIAVWFRLLVSLIIPLRYPFASAFPRAAMRLAVGLVSMSTPPIFWFRSTNWAGVILPCCSAPRPYSTPTLSIGGKAKPWPARFSLSDQYERGSGPKMLMAASWMSQRTPPGLVCALYRWASVTPAQLSVGTATCHWALSLTSELTIDMCPSASAICVGLHATPAPHVFGLLKYANIRW